MPVQPSQPRRPPAQALLWLLAISWLGDALGAALPQQPEPVQQVLESFPFPPRVLDQLGDPSDRDIEARTTAALCLLDDLMGRRMVALGLVPTLYDLEELPRPWRGQFFARRYGYAEAREKLTGDVARERGPEGLRAFARTRERLVEDPDFRRELCERFFPAEAQALYARWLAERPPRALVNTPRSRTGTVTAERRDWRAWIVFGGVATGLFVLLASRRKRAGPDL
jgi:hypothetical protein